MNRQQRAHKAMRKYFQEGSTLAKKMKEDERVKEVTDKLLDQEGIFYGTFITGGPDQYPQIQIHKI